MEEPVHLLQWLVLCKEIEATGNKDGASCSANATGDNRYARNIFFVLAFPTQRRSIPERQDSLIIKGLGLHRSIKPGVG